MTEISYALAWLEEILQEKRPSIYEALLPGLTVEEIDRIVKDFPFQLPKEVYELYQWRNGSESDDSFYGDLGFFSRLSWCVERYSVWAKIWGSESPPIPMSTSVNISNLQFFPLMPGYHIDLFVEGSPLQQEASRVTTYRTDGGYRSSL